MADELVLNFDLPSAAPATTRARSQKGGRWTDRAKERKRGQIEHRKAQRGDAPAPNHTASPHGTKRQRDDDDDRTAHDYDDRRPNKTKAPRPTGGPAPPGHHRPQQEIGFGGKKQFVSSLFTRDGLPEPAPSTSSAPVAPVKPSNAPLTSAAAAAAAANADDQQQDDAPDPAPELTKLGLSRELVAGLAGKLGITGPTACQAGAIPRLVPSAAHGPHKRKQRDFAHDAILRAQTGSGKTLTFLLPMVQDLLSLPPSLLRSATASSSSSSSGPDRSIGTLALILAPTRELASQIHTVLESLLSSLPSSAPASAAQPFSISPRALTAGLLVGGANRTHEKRRLRKGCPIVVATPGRLLDHLKTTEAFRLAGEAARVKGPQGRPGNPNNAPLGARSAPGGGPGDARVGLRWLVVDECDRLMDLGFEEQMKGILDELERRSAASPKGPAREWGRRTILCSATASEGVDRLAGLALGNGGDGDGAAGGEMPVLGARDDVRVKEPVRKDLTALGVGAKGGADDDEDDEAAAAATDGDDGEATALALPTGFTPPSQLLHHFVVVPPKLRFVALVALLRKLLVRQQQSGKGSKILVFMSCTDAVDFWWSALGKMRMGSSSSDEAAALEHDAEEREADSNDDESKRLVSTHPLLPAVPIYRLHGSLPLQTRLASLGAFSGKYKIAEGKRAGQDTDAGVLLCTSVAARGLDVKNVGCVVQVDAPTEGGVTEYVHRVGRTARAGAQGTAYTFLLPTETAYTSFLESGINASAASGGGKLRLREVGVEQVLREGYGGEGREYETRATDVQMGFERWVSASEETASAARRAFQAHVRAYATHPSAEKSIFNTKALHLGHLAKSFGMREAPGHAAPTKGGKKGGANSRSTGGNGGGATKRERDENDGSGGAFETGRRRKAMDAEAKMKKLMRGPKANGGGEFQIAGSDMLEGMVKRK